MRLAILGACADTFYVLIDGLHFEPRCVDEFSKRRATLALRQPAVVTRNVKDFSDLGLAVLNPWDAV